MKDIEKIKSEDLAAQVQDANPGNFAIEQEVAQLVGATVPKPTEPSADDARELGAQLLVFLRRALLPIKSALRTAVASIYAHLDSRCTAYTPAAYASFRILPYDPMRTPPTPRTLPNLLTALTAFSDRKISEPNAVDGMSLAQIVCSSYAPTKIYDNNSGWTMSKNLPWSHLTELVLGCEWATSGVTVIKDQDVEDVVLPNLKGLPADQPGGYNYSLTLISGSPNVKRIYAPKLVHTGGYQYIYIVSGLQYLEELDLPSYEEFQTSYGYGIASNCPALKKINMPKYKYNNSYSGLFKDLPALEEAYLQSITDLSHHSWGGCSVNNCPELHTLVLGVMTSSNAASLTGCPKLLHLEFAGVTGSIDISGWSPTLDSSNLQQFLQNFKEHIALRLTSNGSGKTLTLSQAVFSAVIEGSSPICDDIKGIIEDKGWKVQDTNNNIFPTT